MSFPRYPKYKASGVEWVGEVPDHWGICSFRHCLSQLFNGLTSTQVDESENTVPVTRIETISGGVIDELKLGFVNEEDARDDRRLLEGDILFSNINSLNMVGNCAFYPGGRTIYAGMNLLVLRSSNKCFPRWLFWLVRSSIFRSVVESLAKPAINQASISQSSINSIVVSIPSLPEQTQIAAFLDRETAKIDELVAEQRRLMELLKEKRQAAISHAVTKGLNPKAPMKPSGIEWLGDVPKHWEVKRFQRCVYVAEGQVDPESPNYSEMPLIAPNHIESSTGRLLGLESASEQGAESGKYLCKEGDVVYSKIRPALRKVCIAPVECLCSADMYPLRPHSGLTNAFLLWSMLSEQFSAFAVLESQRVAMPKINRESLKEALLSVPPLEEQRTIVAYIDIEVAKFDALTAEAQRAIDLLQERRTALISAAVTGQIDVRQAAPIV